MLPALHGLSVACQFPRPILSLEVGRLHIGIRCWLGES